MSDRQLPIAPQTHVKRTSNASQTSGFATWQPSRSETTSCIRPPKSHLKSSKISDRQSLIASQTHVKRTSNAIQTTGFATWQPSRPETTFSIGPPKWLINISDRQSLIASQTHVKRISNAVQTSGFATWQPSRPETTSSYRAIEMEFKHV